MITDQVEVHKAEFKNLEKDSIYERKRLTNEIRRKEEQLEMYYQSHRRDSRENSELNRPINHLHLLDKSSSLSKKCSGLQKQVAGLQEQLKKQMEKSKSDESKLTTANLAIQNLNQSDRKPHQIDEVTMKNLLNQNAALRDDLQHARQERDKLAKEFSFILEKYHELVGRKERRSSIKTLSGDRQGHSNSKKKVQLWTGVDKTSNRILRPIVLSNSADIISKHAIHHATRSTSTMLG